MVTALLIRMRSTLTRAAKVEFISLCFFFLGPVIQKKTRFYSYAETKLFIGEVSLLSRIWLIKQLCLLLSGKAIICGGTPCTIKEIFIYLSVYLFHNLLYSVVL